MKSNIKQSNKKGAFTIIELLTVMSIIVILIGILVPALSRAKRYARDLSQRAQFKAIDDMLADFSSPAEMGGYGKEPPSEGEDMTGQPYCGAMKLAEAMVGLDLMGFHPASVFRRDGMDATGNIQLYNLPPTDLDYERNIKDRHKMYLPLETAYKLGHVYGIGSTGPFDPCSVVLCDAYNSVTNQDTTHGAKRRIGMPILYYKAADVAAIWHDTTKMPGMTYFENNGNIYNYLDNQDLLDLPKPGSIDPHPLADPIEFYKQTRDHKIALPANRPYRPDSYILISAGYDGEYGTEDDIFNILNWKYKEYQP